MSHLQLIVDNVTTDEKVKAGQAIVQLHQYMVDAGNKLVKLHADIVSTGDILKVVELMEQFSNITDELLNNIEHVSDQYWGIDAVEGE